MMLRRIITTLERRGLMASPSPEEFALFGAVPTAAGKAVTPETALRSPMTLAACRAIAESIGSLPFHLFRRQENGERERDHTHPASAILAGDWCPWAGGVETRTALQLDALLHGAGYALVVRAGSQPRELHRLDPRAVAIDTTGSEPRFKVKDGGIERVHNWRDVLYVPTPGSTFGRNICLINCAREAIALDLLMVEHEANLFTNGARPSGVLKHGKVLGEAAAKRLRAQFEATHGGGANVGRTLVLEEGMEFVALQFSSVDLQFLELKRLAGQDIARAFKVPGTLVGDLDRATWRNVEELMRQFMQTCLMPWAEVWQSALERTLLTVDERRDYFIEAKFDDLLRGDLAGRFQALREATGGAWMTPNEARSLENRPPVPGGDELIRQAGQADASTSQDETLNDGGEDAAS